jgi:hypothetical protein
MANQAQIEVSSPSYFTVTVPPHGFLFFGVMGGLVLVFVAIRVFQMHHRFAGALAALGAIGMLWIATPSSVSHRAEGDGNARTFHIEELERQVVVDQSLVSFNSIERIDMQSDRSACRIAIIMNNGAQRFPLGEGYVQDDPGQYRALVLMEQMWKNGAVDATAVQARQ